MGWAGFQELYRKKDRFHIKILARGSKKNLKKLAPYEWDPDVTVVWGDMMDYNDVLTGVSGADYVLHVGGMVSPAADYQPEQTRKVNVTSAQNIVRAILAQPNADEIKLVYIGSVAQCGDRLAPLHWGQTGDPVYASLYDAYSVSKCKAEEIIVNSGIRHWVSLRQSGILYPGILKGVSATVFHVPVNGMLEWTTIEDSARVLSNVVEDWVGEDFWNRFYNISSGEQYRMTNYEFESRLLRTLGLPSPEKVFEPQWFATQNFHGMWYTDADTLEGYLHFRENVPIDDYFKRLKKQMAWFYNLAFLAPAFLVKRFMKPYAYEKNLGTQWCVANDLERTNAFYGSIGNYKNIKSWEQIRPQPWEKNLAAARSKGEVRVLDHGYDTSKSIYEMTREEIEAAAQFRGGHFLSTLTAAKAPESRQEKSALLPKNAVYKWKCENGHEFEATLEYVLLGGGWCTECPIDGVLANTTSKNRFISQVVRPQSPE